MAPWRVRLAVLVAGGAVMAIEVLGTRVLAPAFGAGIYVWAALLTTTLAALALGYALGGALADRRPEVRSLGVVLGAASVALAVGLLTAPFALRWGMGLSPQVGALLTAPVLFGAALCALGMTGPIAVRLEAESVLHTGHNVGRVYALSTVGSLAGTLLVVFVLVPRWETSTILWGTAAVLCGLGALLLAGRARVGSAALSSLLVAGALASAANGMEPRVVPAPLRVTARLHSPYGLLEVIDDVDRGLRFMRADHSVIGAARVGGLGAFDYTHALEALRFARPAADSMLQIGLGAGTLPTAMASHGFVVDVVEIDPGVKTLAEAHFEYRPAGRVAVEDARTFINRAPRRYDLVVHDTFTGGLTPSHLLSQEVFVGIRRLLREGGVLALVAPGFADGPDARLVRVVARTLRAVFPHVRAFRDGAPGEPQLLSNILFFASDAPIEFPVPTDGAAFESPQCMRAAQSLTTREVLRDVPPGPVATDAHNPLTWMQSPIAAAHYDAMLRLLPAAAWLPW